MANDLSWLDKYIVEQQASHRAAGISPAMFSAAADYSEEAEVMDAAMGEGPMTMRWNRLTKARPSVIYYLERGVDFTKDELLHLADDNYRMAAMCMILAFHGR